MLTVGYTLHVPWLCLSVCTWILLYFSLRRLEPSRQAEWHCRLVTVLHASLISVLSGWSALVQGPWPFTDAGGPSTSLQVVVVTICLGYFLFDFTWCLYYQTEGFPMLLHHFLSIVGMTVTLVAGRYGTEMSATIFGSELTNPLLQLRWFLKETGHYRTWAGEIVDFLFMTLFFSLRIGVGSVLLFCYFRQPTTDFWGRLGAVCIYLIGWMFWVSIAQYALYKYRKKFRHHHHNDDDKARENLRNSDEDESLKLNNDSQEGEVVRKGRESSKGGRIDGVTTSESESYIRGRNNDDEIGDDVKRGRGKGFVQHDGVESLKGAQSYGDASEHESLKRGRREGSMMMMGDTTQKLRKGQMDVMASGKFLKSCVERSGPGMSSCVLSSSSSSSSSSSNSVVYRNNTTHLSGASSLGN